MGNEKKLSSEEIKAIKKADKSKRDKISSNETIQK